MTFQLTQTGQEFESPYFHKMNEINKQYLKWLEVLNENRQLRIKLTYGDVYQPYGTYFICNKEIAKILNEKINEKD